MNESKKNNKAFMTIKQGIVMIVPQESYESGDYIISQFNKY